MQRIIGFDLARAYAIFGMIVVNFNMIFGSYDDESTIGQFLSMFSGNSSTIFVILAGMGVVLMANRKAYSLTEKVGLRNTILKRALFLFIFGHLFNILWTADILHFYSWYMFIAAFILFIDRKYFIWLALFAILVFHILVLLLPFDTGWDFETFEYKDFYTINGFIRNTFYNGWNSIFPWVAFFLLGMYLGRLNWTLIKVQRKMFFTGFTLYLTISVIQHLSKQSFISEETTFFINADYLPPFLPFVISTVGFGLMVISGAMYLGDRIGKHKISKSLALTGRMTLTHYVAHILFGIILISIFEAKDLSKNISMMAIELRKPINILLLSTTYFFFCCCFSVLWAKYFKNGPLEMILRRSSG